MRFLIATLFIVPPALLIMSSIDPNFGSEIEFNINIDQFFNNEEETDTEEDEDFPRVYSSEKEIVELIDKPNKKESILHKLKFIKKKFINQII